jgi:hypothetical protein
MAAKIFEVGDVLPATTQLRISWIVFQYELSAEVETDNGNFKLVYQDFPYHYVDDIVVYDHDDGVWESPYNDTDHAYVDIDTSTWSESKRTISYYYDDSHASLFWEDLAPAPSGIGKLYKGDSDVSNQYEKIYKGSELLWKKQTPPPTNVVVFKSDSPRTITPKFKSGVTLQYSIDNGSTWNNISSYATTASSDEIWFRGSATGAKSLFSSASVSNRWGFSGDASNKLHVYGDLRYLLCDNLGDNTITFNIASNCFSFMFYDCTSLTTAPSLPATTLASYCYSSMFYNCTSLTTAPSLPARTLANNCYANMFNGCTSLTTAPSLSATTLADFCYSSMFYNCTSLTTAPSLPARTLALNCYQNMFNGCTAFKVSTTKTGSYQYSWRIPTSGTIGTTPSFWNPNMLANTGGTFTSDPNINTAYYVENPPV